MLNKSIKFLIEHKLVAIILFVLFIGFGLINAPFNRNNNLLPSHPVSVDAIPDIGENQQIVFTKWQGQSPQDIEDQITYPLTSALLGIPGVKTIRSSSMFGFSSIYIIFKEDVEFYWSRSRILEKLNSLPKGLLPNNITPTLGPDATSLGQIYWYTLEGRDNNGNVTGGWDLHELRSIQDYYVKNALSATSGVSEVASIGGHKQEYQIDVNPELLRQYNISLNQVVKATKETNKDIGAQTIEINKVEYLVRGLGRIKSINDIENTVVSSNNFTPIHIKDIAKVTLGPATRRGILDKEGAEVVGAVVTARYGANPLAVINNLKKNIAVLAPSLPSKILPDGRTSKITVVPFYDRSELIHETLGTLNEALTLEILVTILVITVMLFNLRASILITGLLPVAILMVFSVMKLFNVEANIVALSGIAIAIGTMVDIGVILIENIIRHLKNSTQEQPLNKVVYKATAEISGAIITAVATTIVSFLPVFTLSGAEGKLFSPLAFTKTFALVSALVVALFLIPVFATIVFKKTNLKKNLKISLNIALISIGVLALFYGYTAGVILVFLGVISILNVLNIITNQLKNTLNNYFTILTVIYLLSIYWNPLKSGSNNLFNIIFVACTCFSILGGFWLLKKYYTIILDWCLRNKMLFLSIPIALLISGFLIMKNIGREFMPSLNEGAFLLMPTSMSHAGIEENKRILQQLDMAVANIPEIKMVVGKAGRTESALDPAPLSMYENIIQYKSEYILNNEGEKQRFKVNSEGLFILTNGKSVANPNITKNSIYSQFKTSLLIPDNNGNYYRNWRPNIKSPNDIWNEITKVTKLPGITSAPKLQPIETRLVMLQTGMRSPMGIKIKGQNLQQIEAFGIQLEKHLKQVNGVKKEAVFAERIVGKPYLLIDIDRDKIAQYGLTIKKVQDIINIAVGGLEITQTIQGRERYAVRVRYPKELRSSPTDLQNIYVPTKKGKSIPLSELATINYEKGPQVIKSENTHLIGYVLFDKQEGFAEVNVVESAQDFIKNKIANKELIIPNGISYEFTGSYENQLRAQKTLSLIVPLTLLIILLILYFQFRSLITAFMIFTGITVAFSGGFIMVWLYGQDWFLNFSFLGQNLRELFQIKTINLSVAVWVGFIALFGIATDDGVIMATYLSQKFKKASTKNNSEIRQLVIKAGNKRIKPCLMTTATTVLALLPVLTSTGRGSDIMTPMAIPVFGGMLIDITSYFLLPVLYSLHKEIQLKRKK